MTKTRRRTATVAPVVAGLAALFLALPSSVPGTRVEITAAGETYRYAVDGRDARSGPLEIGVRDDVTFVNETDVTHSVSCDACPDDALQGGDVQPGGRVTVSSVRPGEYRLFCRYHRAQGGEEITIRVTG